MSTKAKEKNTSDWWKWLVSAIILAAGFYANYHFIAIAAPVRIIGWIVLFAIIFFIIGHTGPGRAGIRFTSEARVEMRKVVWPNRHEVTRSTFVILGLVALCGVILWLIDSGLIVLIGWLTGQRG